MYVVGHHDAGVRVRVHEEADPVAVCPLSPVACRLLWVGTQNRIRWGTGRDSHQTATIRSRVSFVRLTSGTGSGILAFNSNRLASSCQRFVDSDSSWQSVCQCHAHADTVPGPVAACQRNSQSLNLSMENARTHVHTSTRRRKCECYVSPSMQRRRQ